MTTSEEEDYSSVEISSTTEGSQNAEEEEEDFYPDDPRAYKIIEVTKASSSSTTNPTTRSPTTIVYKAECIPLARKLVAIKTINLSSASPDFKYKLKKHHHPNILNPLRTFKSNHTLLYVVQPFMPSGSLRSAFPNGLSEPLVAAVMKQVLLALAHLHESWNIHRAVTSGNIFLHNSSVFLSDFRTSSAWVDPQRTLNPSPQEAFTLAPELLHREIPYEYTEDTDIWSFGVTAMELAHGRPPLSSLVGSKEKKFSECFKDMVSSCLEVRTGSRPAASSLLEHPFFKECGDLGELKGGEAGEVGEVGGFLEVKERITGWKLDREMLVLDACIRRVRFSDEVRVHYFESEGEETTEESGEEEEERLENLWRALGEIETDLEENRSVFNSMVSERNEEEVAALMEGGASCSGGGDDEGVFHELEALRKTNEELQVEVERIRRGLSG